MINPTRHLPVHAVSGSAWILILAATSSLCGQTPPITDIVFAPDGKSLVSCSQQGLQVFSWPELKSKKSVRVLFANVHCLAFSPDGSQLAVGGGNPSDEGIVQIFSWPNCQSTTKLSQHDDSVLSIAWRDNQHLVSAGLDRLLILWNLETGNPVKTYQGHSRGVSSNCILNHGEMVTAGYDQSVRVWNTESAALTRTLNQHSKPINSMATCPLSAGNPMVATASADRTIRFWQPTIGRMMRYVRLHSEPLDIDWINKSLIVASCVDGQARLVDTDNVKVLTTLPAIQGWAYTVAAHPNDGTLAIAGSGGQLLRLRFQKPK